MKYILLFILAFSTVTGMAQTEGVTLNRIIYKPNDPSTHLLTTNALKKSYKIKIRLMNMNYYVNGLLYDIKDSSVLVFSYPNFLYTSDYYSNGEYYYKFYSVDISNIKSISYRRTNSIGVGIGIGAVGGLLVGGTIGYMQGDDSCKGMPWCVLSFSAEQKSLIYSVPGMMIGMAIGGFIGASYTTFRIDGKKSEYDNYKKELKEFSIVH